MKVLAASCVFLGCGGLMVACNADPSHSIADAAGGAGGSSSDGGAAGTSAASRGAGGGAGAPGDSGGSGGIASGGSNAASRGGGSSAGGSAGAGTQGTSDSSSTANAGGNGGAASAGTTDGPMTSTSDSGGATNSGGSNTTSSGSTGGAGGSGGGTAGVLLFEDFEDGNYDAWQLGSGNYALTIVSDPAADNSGQSLSMTGESDFHQGLSYHFDDVQPSYVSYWVYPTQVDGAHAYFVLSAPGSTAIENQVVFIYFAGGEILVAGSDFFEPLASGDFVVDQWHHIELQFDWTTDSIDLTLNGNVLASDVAFRATAFGYDVDAIARLDIFHVATDSHAYWDEILVQ